MERNRFNIYVNSDKYKRFRKEVEETGSSVPYELEKMFEKYHKNFEDNRHTRNPKRQKFSNDMLGDIMMFLKKSGIQRPTKEDVELALHVKGVVDKRTISQYWRAVRNILKAVSEGLIQPDELPFDYHPEKVIQTANMRHPGNPKQSKVKEFLEKYDFSKPIIRRVKPPAEVN